jgi:hypothetical protein
MYFHAKLWNTQKEYLRKQTGKNTLYEAMDTLFVVLETLARRQPQSTLEVKAELDGGIHPLS